MTTIQEADILLVVAFLQDLLAKQDHEDSLQAQNLSWSIRVVNETVLRSRKRRSGKEV